MRFVRNKDIDYERWDQCVSASSVPLMYAQSWYLDLISPGWDALIMDDYEFVMPLIIKQKFGISYFLQPAYGQQHGVFPDCDLIVQNTFLATVREKFRYVTINLNARHSEPFPQGFIVEPRDNFILDLSLPLEELKNNYSKHTRRQIRKAEDHKVFVVNGLSAGEYFDLKTSAAKGQPVHPSLQTLRRVMNFGLSRGLAMIYGAYNQHNTLCAAAFFIFAGQRVTYLNAVSNEEGKTTNAMHKIIDQFIQEHAGRKLTLDFEGSVIEGIARFYKGFGAQAEQYYCLKSNRLPIPLRWLKK